MLWYYDAIIDWMVANPGRPLSECAAHIHRRQATLSIIINSDMFKAALARRKEQFRQMHDVGLIEKTTKVAHASLDSLLLALEKKKDSVPLDTLREISDSALTRLGYGVQPGGSGGVNIQVNGQATIVAPVSSQDLAEARMALRQVQETKARALPQSSTTKLIEHDPLEALLSKTEATSVDVAEKEVVHDPATDSA